MFGVGHDDVSGVVACCDVNLDRILAITMLRLTVSGVEKLIRSSLKVLKEVSKKALLNVKMGPGQFFHS